MDPAGRSRRTRTRRGLAVRPTRAGRERIAVDHHGIARAEPALERRIGRVQRHRGARRVVAPPRWHPRCAGVAHGTPRTEMTAARHRGRMPQGAGQPHVHMRRPVRRDPRRRGDRHNAERDPQHSAATQTTNGTRAGISPRPDRPILQTVGFDPCLPSVGLSLRFADQRLVGQADGEQRSAGAEARRRRRRTPGC
jgi:hypothetical protein